MGARIKAYDPVAMTACQEQHPELKIQYCKSMLDAVADADAMVIVTEWQEFRTANLHDLAQQMARPVLVDGRNIFEPDRAREAGFDYTGIGRREKLAQKVVSMEPVTQSAGP